MEYSGLQIRKCISPDHHSPFDALAASLQRAQDGTAQLGKLYIIGLQPNIRDMISMLSKKEMSAFNRSMPSYHLQTSGKMSTDTSVRDMERIRDHHTWCYMQNQVFHLISQVNKYREELISAATNMDEVTAASGKRPRNA